MADFVLYEKYRKLLLPEDQLERYEFAVPEFPGSSRRKTNLALRSQFAPTYICERCRLRYSVDVKTGLQLTSQRCRHHARKYTTFTKTHPCCNGGSFSEGCREIPNHVHEGELEAFNFRGYVSTKPTVGLSRQANYGIFALDCEMCQTVYGKELLQVTIVDLNNKVVYDKLVKPKNIILDYNTPWHGVTEDQLANVTTSLADVQRDLLEMFSEDSILIGHSLHNDLNALKLFHRKVIDTAHLYPHPRGFPKRRALRMLAKDEFGIRIQEGIHSSHEDAVVALALVKKKL